MTEFSWTQPRLKLDNYRIGISLNGSSVYNASIPATQNSLNLTDLEFNTMYVYKLFNIFLFY